MHLELNALRMRVGRSMGFSTNKEEQIVGTAHAFSTRTYIDHRRSVEQPLMV